MMKAQLIWGVLTSLCLWRAQGVDISACCDQAQTLSVETAECGENSDTGSVTNKTHFTPKIFSFAAETFVEETIELRGALGVPQCSDGQVILTSHWSKLIILSSDWSIFRR